MSTKTPFPLLPVPPFHHELTIKASNAGITVLTGARYKKRYTGSKQSTVDINGRMWLKSSDFKKFQDAEQAPDPRRKRAATQSDIAIAADAIQERKRNYTVNKVEVRNRLFGMINTMRGKKELYFWTVTFPARTPDDQCYKLFNTWLTTLRQKKWLREYIWIAERQTGERLKDKSKATNTIHFHIGIPHKMNAKNANAAMRVTLATAAKKNEIPFNIYQCRRYNGIDIAKNRKTRRVTNFAIKKGARSLAYYLTKYVTKNNDAFNHLAWHNSRGFSSLFTGITFTQREFLDYGFRQLVFPKAVIKNEYFLFFAWKDEPPEAITKHLCEVNSWIQEQTGVLDCMN